MKQLLFFVTALILAVLPVKAQTSQVATLSHEGTITTFYSANALKDAYAAAVDGDVITLSSGTFTSVNIEKNITLRGAGMMPDEDPTIITGDLEVNCPISETNYLTLEGFYQNGRLKFSTSKTTTDVRIVKCQFKEFTFAYVKNLTAVNTFFRRFYTYSDGRASGTFINSLIDNCGIATGNSSSITSASFTNCVFWFGSSNFGGLYNSLLKNCIIGNSGALQSMYFPENTIASYCYYYGPATAPFRNSPSTTNHSSNKSPDDVFSDTNLQILKDELQTTWLGEDGTQVGIYGGFLPFDPTPTNPQITKFNVASKTTADGKLSVDIEVKAN